MSLYSIARHYTHLHVNDVILQMQQEMSVCCAVWPTGILRCRFFQKQQLRKIKSIQVSAQDAFFHLISDFQKHPKAYLFI